MRNQRLEMERFCGRRDWVIASVYEDNGYSGITNDRPTLKNMLRDAAKGLFSVVVVWDVSRLTRSMSDLTDILWCLTVHGVDFCIANQAMGYPDHPRWPVRALMTPSTSFTKTGKYASAR